LKCYLTTIIDKVKTLQEGVRKLRCGRLGTGVLRFCTHRAYFQAYKIQNIHNTLQKQ